MVTSPKSSANSPCQFLTLAWFTKFRPDLCSFHSSTCLTPLGPLRARHPPNKGFPSPKPCVPEICEADSFEEKGRTLILATNSQILHSRYYSSQNLKAFLLAPFLGILASCPFPFYPPCPGSCIPLLPDPKHDKTNP